MQNANYSYTLYNNNFFKTNSKTYKHEEELKNLGT